MGIRRKNKSKINQFLMNAVRYFELLYDCKVDCKFVFFEGFVDTKTRGFYDLVSNTVTLLGCHVLQRNRLVETLFHELIHYWQYKIEKTLQYVEKCPTYSFCGEINTSSHSKSLLNDVYHRSNDGRRHSYKFLFKENSTSSYSYYDKPHEVEARELAKNLRTLFMQSGHYKRTIKV